MGIAYNEAKVNDGIASLVQLVQSIYKDETKLDFEGAMDRLERESKTGKPLLIDLTTQEEEGTNSSNSSSDSSGHDSDDSDYKAGDDCTKQGQKKKARRKKIETQDKGDKPQNEDDNLTMLSRVCGDVIGGGIGKYR